MTIERFLNHIYYSFQSLDRPFSISPNEFREGNKTEIMAGSIMGLTAVGYLVGVIWIIPSLLMIHYHLTIPKEYIALISFVTIVPCLSYFTYRYFNNGLFTKYYDEFSQDPNYSKWKWHSIACFVVLGAAVFFCSAIYLISMVT